MITFKQILERLFHKDKYIPPEAIRSVVGRTFSLRYTAHAQQAAQTDKYGKIELSKIPSAVRVEQKDIIELETDDATGRVVKIVLRRPYDTTRDVAIVFIPTPEGQGVVKTIWFNMKSDVHRTLKFQRYASAPSPGYAMEHRNSGSVQR